jgi:DNA-binding response OmpR family regulator
MTQKILIIEDNKDLNNLLYFLFEERKYTVQSCFDGERGFELVQEFRPDIVILDILLPKMDGRDILSYIQTMNPRPRVIVFSSSGWKEVKAKNISYCPKGIHFPEMLLKMVNNISENDKKKSFH